MKSKGSECLLAHSKTIKSKICFEIFNTPNLKFKENNPLKIKTFSIKQLNLDTKDYPKSYIKYKSNNQDIIEVNNEGKINALRPGKAIITSFALDNISTKIEIFSIPYEGLIDTYILESLNASLFKNLMIVAHPDDETLWGGAHLLNESFFIVCLTNGYNLPRVNDFNKVLKFTKKGGLILNYPDLQDNIPDIWSEAKIGILKDLSTILNYKDWEKIVTHGPEGTTGHIHHKKTSEYVTYLTKKFNKFNKLYYFGKYYKINKIPKNLSRISDKELEFKKKVAAIYRSSRSAINYLYNMMPYENWVSASKIK